MKRSMFYPALLIGIVSAGLAFAQPEDEKGQGGDPGVFVAAIRFVLTVEFVPGTFDRSRIYVRLQPEQYVARLGENRPRTSEAVPPFERDFFETVAREAGHGIALCPPGHGLCCSVDEDWTSIGFSPPDVRGDEAKLAVDIMYRVRGRSRSEGRNLELVLERTKGTWNVREVTHRSYSGGVACPTGTP